MYGYGRIAPKSANIPTEHISAKELKVDGKQYLAVELKEQSDNLKEGAVSSEVVAPLTLTTELITARQLEVDGKQYLAVEARDSSDQLKKAALAAALTGAAQQPSVCGVRTILQEKVVKCHILHLKVTW